MISPWSLFKESIRLFLKNFKYLLKFWLASTGVLVAGILPAGLLAVILGFRSPLLIPLGLIYAVVYIFLILWTNSANYILIKSVSQNQAPTLKELFSQGWKIIGKILLTGLLAGLAVVGGLLLLIIPGIIFSYWFAFTTQIVVIENLSGTAALSRSKQLVNGRFWKIVWYMLFPILIVIAYSFITSAVAAAIPKPSRAVFEVLFSIVTWPFGLVSLIYSFLVYREFTK